MTPIPIIFFHYGNPTYLKYTLKQARYFNPDSPIYLIGDKKNDKYPFLKHVAAKPYDAEAAAFTKVYKHLSPNDENYELNCFLRWFYVRAFCRDNDIQSFIYLDSDVLAFQNFTEIVPLFKPCKLANTCSYTGAPHFTYFADYKTISNFCDFLIYSYTDKAALAHLEGLYNPAEELGGISDMNLFHLFDLANPGDTIKLDIINDDTAVDISVNRVDGYGMAGERKKIYWQNKLPYGKEVASGRLTRFILLHYQGHAKSLIIKHYTAGGYLFQRFWEPKKARYKAIKKSDKGTLKFRRHYLPIIHLRNGILLIIVTITNVRI